jgi:hypothetical protein
MSKNVNYLEIFDMVVERLVRHNKNRTAGAVCCFVGGGALFFCWGGWHCISVVLEFELQFCLVS